MKCLWENTEKYISFSIPIKKETKDGKTITYKLKFIDSYRFMAAALERLTDNLSELSKTDCKKCKSKYDFIKLKIMP